MHVIFAQCGSRLESAESCSLRGQGRKDTLKLQPGFRSSARRLCQQPAAAAIRWAPVCAQSLVGGRSTDDMSALKILPRY